MEKSQQLKGRLNLLGRGILKKDNSYHKAVKKSIFYALFIPIVIIDLGATWFANLLHPDNDFMYWETYFALSSLKVFFISLLCRMAYEFYIFRPLKNNLSLWLVNSWLGFCVSDLIDVLCGDRSEFTHFDAIAVVFCAVSFFKSYKRFLSSEKQNN